MVGKSNINLRREKNSYRTKRFAIRKTKWGVASIAVATLLYFGGNQVVHADSSIQSTSTVAKTATTTSTPAVNDLQAQTTAANREALKDAKQNLDQAVATAEQAGFVVKKDDPTITTGDVSDGRAGKQFVATTTKDYNDQATVIQQQVEADKAKLAQWEQERAEQEKHYDPNQAIPATDVAHVENTFEYNSHAKDVDAYYVEQENGQEKLRPISLTDANFNVLPDQSGQPRNFGENDNPVRLQVNDVTANTVIRIKWTDVLTDVNTGKHYDMIIELSDPILDKRYREGTGYYEIYRDVNSGIVFDRITALKLTKYLVETGTNNVYEGEDYFTQDTLNRQIPAADVTPYDAPDVARAEFVKPIDGSLAAFIPKGSHIMATPQDISSGNSGAKELIAKINQTRPADQQLSNTVYYSEGFDKYLAGAESIVFLTKGKASFILGTINPVTNNDADTVHIPRPDDPKKLDFVWRDYSQVGFGILDKSVFQSDVKPTITYHYDELQTPETAVAQRKVSYQYAPEVTGSTPELPATVTQTSSYQRTATVDYAQYLQDGTGVVTTAWQNTTPKQFTQVDTPIQKGYYADRVSVGAVADTAVSVDNAGNTTGVEDEVVTYHALGNIVPQTKDGHEIPTNDGGNYRTPYNNDPTDPTKATNTPYPEIPGYHPLSGTSVTPWDPGQDTPVVYVADNQELYLRVFDDQTHQQLDSTMITNKFIGASDAAFPTTDVANNLQRLLAYYQERGYVLHGTLPDGTGYFDRNTQQAQYLDLHLVHGNEVVTNNKTPGQLINPADPNSPTYPTAAQDVMRPVSQRITYSGAGTATPSDKVTTVPEALKRTVTVDKVTGEIVQTTPWSTYTFSNVSSPKIPGYTADQTQAGAGTATAEQPEVSAHVNYAPDYQEVIIRAYDANNPEHVTMITVPAGLATKIAGHTGEVITVDATVTAIKSALTQAGYVFVKQTQPAQLIFDNTTNTGTGDQEPQYIDLEFVHGSQNLDHNLDTRSDLHGQISRQIRYVYGADVPQKRAGSMAAPTVVQTLATYRDGQQDLVTGQITYTPWQVEADQFAGQTSPELPGYIADQTFVDPAEVQSLAGQPQDGNEVVVTYTATDPETFIKYVDDDNNCEQVGAKVRLMGRTLETITPHYTIPAGYEYVSGKQATYTFTTTENPEIVVHLRHQRQTTTEMTYYHRTVHYQTTDGTEAPQDVVQTSTWTRTVTVDLVTGQVVTQTSWQPTTTEYATVVTPNRTGYMPDRLAVANQAVVPTDMAVTVTYTPIAKQTQVTPTNRNVVPQQVVTTEAPQPTKQVKQAVRAKVALPQTGAKTNTMTTVYGLAMAMIGTIWGLFSWKQSQKKHDR
ncbi:mucin-binding protein [Ligilactobacillus saerimneri]|uniref:mucin-binding protein n=1 Tax=Ligilactobacillus saerimneri TaxID=228229 RepID=UPI0024B1DDAA|nr:YSIRK-type signal peptide-containing protein [Ligilactobacillus saerimneri]MDI9206014.1 YSIRK-type signal peptide-containing protein [Ligilactobacillus saerimneri]